MECFDGLASLIVGENPLEVERLWYRMYRGSIYYGRRGVAIQAISAIDIALWDICGKVLQPADPHSAGRQVARLGARLRQHAVPSRLRRPCGKPSKSYVGEGFTAVKFGWGVFGKDQGATSSWWKPRATRLATAATCWWIRAGSSSARRRRRFRWCVRSSRSGRFWSKNCCIRKTTMATGRYPKRWKRGSPAASRKRPNGAFSS